MFSGVFTTECTYGALSFFEYNDSVEREVRSICYASPFGPAPNIYLRGHEAGILFYAYSDYVIFDIQLNISTTECEVVQMHICELNKLCQTQLVCGNFKNYLRKHSLKVTNIDFQEEDIECFEIIQTIKTDICTVLQISSDPMTAMQKVRNLEKHVKPGSTFCVMFLKFALQNEEDTKDAWLYTINGFLGVQNEFSILGHNHSVGKEFTILYSADKEQMCWWRNVHKPVQELGCRDVEHQMTCVTSFRLFTTFHKQNPVQKDGVHFSFILNK